MLTSSVHSQYLQPDYLQPLPTTVGFYYLRFDVVETESLVSIAVIRYNQSIYGSKLHVHRLDSVKQSRSNSGWRSAADLLDVISCSGKHDRSYILCQNIPIFVTLKLANKWLI